MQNDKECYLVDGDRYSYDATISKRGQGGVWCVEIEVLGDGFAQRESRRFQTGANGESAYAKAVDYAKRRIGELMRLRGDALPG